jgi:ppGpp synthetase/RelA/SpoT-type nucleotidyltranferase
MALIDEFLRQYDRERDYYFAVARLTATRCETALTDAGVRHLVTFRAKRPDRLHDKLMERNGKTPYEDLDSIRDDIVDLAGVRIALYFPGDQLSAEAFVEGNFDVEPSGKKTFPEELVSPHVSPSSAYEARFPGYCATHFRVRNRVEDLAEADQRYAEARVEIQIASVLMLAWQEVHHDLVYKPLSGTLSEDELAILDEVNGMVIAGEIAFERLQRAMERRLSEQDTVFASHYDLAAYLHNRAALQTTELEPQS